MIAMIYVTQYQFPAPQLGPVRIAMGIGEVIFAEGLAVCRRRDPAETLGTFCLRHA